MIQSIKIENFKVFKKIEIDDLKRVNLFAGKNNTGKTALLEAIRIAAAWEDISVIRYILMQRGELMLNHWEAYDSLFYRPEFEKNKEAKGQPFEFRVNQFTFDRSYIADRRVNYRLKARGGQMMNVNDALANLPNPLIPRDNLVYIPFGADEYFPIGNYWDQVALTPKEDIVIEILKQTILPGLIRLDIQQNNRIMVRLNGEERPLPLKNLGDGAQRVFMLALALVQARDNILLIDEIESGLHYSVLEKILNVLFKYSEELNVQVLATTHSQDVIRAFTYLLESPDNNENAVFFRLQSNSKTGLIEAVRYEPETLELSIQSNFDPR